MLDDARSQIALLPNWVQVWMRWLNIVFLIGIAFVGSHVEARVTMLIYLLSFPIAFGAFYFVRDVRITGLPHLVLWAPLAAYLVCAAIDDSAFYVFSPYGIWVSVLVVTIAVSCVFDAKGMLDVWFKRPLSAAAAKSSSRASRRPSD